MPFALPPVPAAAVARCHTADLSASLGNLDAGAGSRFGKLVLENTSSRTCTLTGYVGGQFLGSGTKKLPTTVIRDASTVRTIIVKPGAKGVAEVRWTVIPSGNAKCPTPQALLVTPPDETTSLRLTFHHGPVCGGELHVKAVRAQLA